MDLDEALELFIVECRELLEDMEAGLLAVETAQEKSEIINAVFRAAHTIKGSSGLFRETLHNSTPFVLAASVFSPGEFPVASGTGFCPPTSV